MDFMKKINELEKKMEFYEDKKIIDLSTEEIEDFLKFKEELDELTDFLKPLRDVIESVFNGLREVIQNATNYIKSMINNDSDITKVCEYCGTEFTQGYYFEERLKYNHVCQDCVNKHEDTNEFAKCLYEGSAYWTDWSEE